MLLIPCIILCIAVDFTVAIDFCLDPGFHLKFGKRIPPLDYQSPYFFYDSKLRYQCDEGYTLKPRNYVQTCTYNSSKNLEWQPSFFPTCAHAKGCGPPPIVKHATNSIASGAYDKSGKIDSVIRINESNYPIGTRAYYYCFSGYSFKPSPPFAGNSLYPSLTCEDGRWVGDSFQCVSKCFPPEKPFGGYYVPTTSAQYFEVGEQVKYVCYEEMEPHDGSVVRFCMDDGKWNGSTPSCSSSVTTMPINISKPCSMPPETGNGNWLCCADQSDPNVCCGSLQNIQFLCDAGYKVDNPNSVTELFCYGGFWSIYQPPNIVILPENSIPKCIKQDTVTEVSNAPSNGVIRPVIAVSVLVLFLLLIAIIMTFCRPKFQDIKRRWREKKENEDGIIINGQRILLPTYEEAVSTQPFQILCNAASCESLAMPSTSNNRQNLQTNEENNMFQQNESIPTTNSDPQESGSSITLLANIEPSSNIVLNESNDNITNDLLNSSSNDPPLLKLIKPLHHDELPSSRPLSTFLSHHGGEDCPQNSHEEIIVSIPPPQSSEDNISINSATCLIQDTNENEALNISSNSTTV